jgi:transposase-like protein
MERRKFTREFKLEAIRLIKERGVSYAQASQDLGVHTSQLRDWVKKFVDDPEQAFPGHGQMKPEQLEIARLKREVTKLKAERDILKKAAAYFAKESTRGSVSLRSTGRSGRRVGCARGLGVSRGGSCLADTATQSAQPKR